MLVLKYSLPPCSQFNFLIFTPFAVSISDPFFSLYNDWIWDMAKMVMILMLFYSILITALYLTVRGKWSGLVMTLIYHFSSTYLYSIPYKAPLSAWLLAQSSSSFQRENKVSLKLYFVKLHIYILRLSYSISMHNQRVTLLLLWPSASNTLNHSCTSQIFHCPSATCRSIFILASLSLAPKKSAMQVSPSSCCDIAVHIDWFIQLLRYSVH